MLALRFSFSNPCFLYRHTGATSWHASFHKLHSPFLGESCLMSWELLSALNCRYEKSKLLSATETLVITPCMGML